MSKKAAKRETAKQVCPPEEQIRVAAYYNWERTTGGNPVDEETSRRFWLEAEEQVADRKN